MLLEIKGKPFFHLELGQLYLLGKEIKSDKNNFIELEDEENVSQRHCIIETNHNEEAFVFDLFSLKGTLLNNKVLNSLEKTQLKHGDVLKIGAKVIKYIYQEHEMSHDSSGFLEVHKNTSDIIASSPESALQLKKLLGDHNFLAPARPSNSFSNRRSDSFTIPETQHCKLRNSVNASDISTSESFKDNDGKIKFNFDNIDSFDDDDFCIPETQDLITDGKISCSQRPRLLSDIQNEAKQTTILNEEGLTGEESQFRICTQDYNEGFGEEENASKLHSQIIPIIKHSMVVLNKTKDTSDTDLANKSIIDQSEKEMSSLEWSNSKAGHETTEIRADCLTPDLFEFDAITNKINENTDKQCADILFEDEEDLLPTQNLPQVYKKVEKKSLKELEEPCLNKEIEEVFILSDKENRCPEILKPISDMQATQLFEGMDPDTEDDLLTQAFVQPKSVVVSSSSKRLLKTCLKSTLLDDKCTEKTPVTYLADMEKTPLKQMPISSAKVFKKSDKDISIFKKPSSASSSSSENYIDLLMCTPQLIRDSLDESEHLKKNILAVKNRILFGDDTEDEDDGQTDIVKLINVPKSSLDFDKLLPHLNKNPESSRKEYDEQNEAQKLYKFSISFGKDNNEKQSNLSSSLSRDERHAARDKERENSQRKTRAQQTKSKSLTNAQDINLVKKDIETERKERKNEKEEKSKLLEQLKLNEEKEKEINSRGKLRINEIKSKKSTGYKNKEERKKNSPRQFSKYKEEHNISESSTSLGKSQFFDKNEVSKTENKTLPAKRLTRLRSRMEDGSSILTTNFKDQETNNDMIKVTRSRSKTEEHCPIDIITSNTSSKTSKSRKSKTEDNKSENSAVALKKTERKRKGESTKAAVPIKIERKTLRSMHSQESSETSAPSVAISITNVNNELIKDLLKNAKGLWNIATNPADCDILIMDKPLRTFKFLLAMTRGIPIVTTEYLKKLNACKSPNELRFTDYQFLDKDFEKKYKFSLLKSLQAARKTKIFEGFEFLMTANILPIPREIKAIIETSGGYVYNKTPPQPWENQKTFLITSKDDKKDWHKYRRLNKNINIVSTEAVMSAIMCQSSERMNSFSLA